MLILNIDHPGYMGVLGQYMGSFPAPMAVEQRCLGPLQPVRLQAPVQIQQSYGPSMAQQVIYTQPQVFDNRAPRGLSLQQPLPSLPAYPPDMFFMNRPPFANPPTQNVQQLPGPLVLPQQAPAQLPLAVPQASAPIAAVPQVEKRLRSRDPSPSREVSVRDQHHCPHGHQSNAVNTIAERRGFMKGVRAMRSHMKRERRASVEMKPEEEKQQESAAIPNPSSSQDNLAYKRSTSTSVESVDRQSAASPDAPSGLSSWKFSQSLAAVST